MLWYVPLEPVQGRYTEQWSRATTGWMEREFFASGITYKRFEGWEDKTASLLGAGTVGAVYDTQRRIQWCFNQISQIITELGRTRIKPNIIFFDDVWHPGLEGLVQYLKSSPDFQNKKIKLAGFCHAQSVDKWDFMARLPLRDWERAMVRSFDAVFVNSNLLAELLTQTEFISNTVFNAGHVFSSNEVLGRNLSNLRAFHERRNRILFTSRFDEEKDPERFIDMMNLMKSNGLPDDWSFAMLSGASTIRSNNPRIESSLRRLQETGALEIRTGLSKAEYYEELRTSKFQVSCSLQDWTSFCLLEALTWGCYPVYPNYRSFPEAFAHYSNALYPYNERMLPQERAIHLASFMLNLIKDGPPLDELHQPIMRRSIIEYHNGTVRRILELLGLK